MLKSRRTQNYNGGSSDISEREFLQPDVLKVRWITNKLPLLSVYLRNWIETSCTINQVLYE